VKCIFLCFSIKASLVEMLKHFLNMPVMFIHVIQVDKYIIQIDHDINIQKVGENVVYKLLKDHESIGKTKGHCRPLK